MPNTDLLRRTLTQIEAHPETWDQKNWGIETDCGTAYCFAGWAVVLSDLPLDWDLEEDEFENQRVVANRTSEDAPLGFRLRSIFHVAKQLLDLSMPQAEHLFHADNSLDELRSQVAELTAEPAPADRP